MNKSDSIKNIASALHRAQADIIGAVKDSDNPFFKSKYANLESVMAAIRAPFQANGLSYVQASRVSDSGLLILETVLMHISGEWISSEYPVVPVKSDPASLGAATTYARRFSLSSMCGVTQVDDDGASSSLDAVREIKDRMQAAKTVDEARGIWEDNLNFINNLPLRDKADLNAFKDEQRKRFV